MINIIRMIMAIWLMEIPVLIYWLKSQRFYEYELKKSIKNRQAFIEYVKWYKENKDEWEWRVEIVMRLLFVALGFYVGLLLFAFLAGVGLIDWLIDRLGYIKQYRKVKKELKENKDEL